MNKDIQVAMVSKPALDLRLLPEDILIIIEVGGKEKFVGKTELLRMLQGCVVSSTGTQALYNSSPLGGTNTTFNMALPNTGTANTSNTNGYWVKFG